MAILKLIRDGEVRIYFSAQNKGRDEKKPPDFANSCWGDSMEEVSRQEGEGEWRLQTVTQFDEYEILTQFAFDDQDSLAAVFYDLAGSDDISQLSCYEKYRLAKKRLTELYGEPYGESFIAPDGSRLSSLEETEKVRGSAHATWQLRSADGALFGAASVSYNYRDQTISAGIGTAARAPDNQRLQSD